MINYAAFAQKGQIFHLTTEVTANAVNFPTLLFINPGSNSSPLRPIRSFVGTDSTTTGLVSALPGIFIHRIFANPTVTANGTTLNPVSSLVTASPPTSQIQTFSSPTVSANGNRMLTVICEGASVNVELADSIVVNPGNSILVTCSPVNPSSVMARYYFSWLEI